MKNFSLHSILIVLLFLVAISGNSQSKVKNKNAESLAPKLNDSKISTLNSVEERDEENRGLYYENQYVKERSRRIDINTKQLGEKDQRELDKIVKTLEVEAPNSAGYYYVSYLNANPNSVNIENLDRAFELTSDKTSLYDDYIGYYELTQNADKKKEFCEKLYKSKAIPSGVMEYNYNVLMSVEKGGILFVNGADDTYPIWVYQNTLNVRKDVTILNTDLLGVDAYRAKKLRDIGVGINLDYNADRLKFIISVAKENPDKPIYFALTFSKSVLNGLKDNLYLTGLALKYSPNKMDNLPILKQNWEEKFKTKTLEKSQENGTVKNLNRNYILPMFQLSELYKMEGDESESKKLKKTILKLAKEGGKESKVIKYIQERE